MNVSQLVGAGFAVLAAVGLAVQGLSIRLGTRTNRLTDVIAVVFGINLLILLSLAGILAYPHYRVTWTAVAAFVVAGLIGSLLARVGLFLGITRLGASRAEPLKALFPLFAVGPAVLVLGEQIHLSLLVGMGLLVAGGATVAVEARDSPVTATGRQVWVDMLLPLSAALFLGIDPIFTKIGLAEGTPALVGVTIRVGAAAAGFGLYLGWRRATRGERIRMDSIDRWVLIAGVANTVYLLAYYAALSHAPVSVVTPLLGVSTLFVVIGAAAFLQDHERVTTRLVGAAVLVVLALLKPSIDDRSVVRDTEDVFSKRLLFVAWLVAETIGFSHVLEGV